MKFVIRKWARLKNQSTFSGRKFDDGEKKINKRTLL